MRVDRCAVVKVGTSSITSRRAASSTTSRWPKLCGDVADGARPTGTRSCSCRSGAIAAGLPALGLATRPTDIGTLQAIAAVGQPR